MRLLFFFIFSLLLLHNAEALAVTPPRLEFDSVLRGSVIERVVVVHNTRNKDANFAVSGEWFEVENGRVMVKAKGSADVKVKLVVPNDLPNGMHKTRLYVTEVNDVKGVAINTAVAADVTINVVGEEHISGNAYKLLVRDAELGNAVIFLVGLQNTGNVATKFRVVFDVAGEIFERVFEVGAFKKQDFEVEWMPEMAGSYKANVDVYLDNRLIEQKMLGFEVSGRNKLKPFLEPKVVVFATLLLLVAVLCILYLARKVKL